MTNPVDTDALRETADAIGHLAGDVTAQQDIEAAADEIDRLRAVIENAPHSNWCATEDSRRVYQFPPGTCWKADAL